MTPAVPRYLRVAQAVALVVAGPAVASGWIGACSSHPPAGTTTADTRTAAVDDSSVPADETGGGFDVGSGNDVYIWTDAQFDAPEQDGDAKIRTCRCPQEVPTDKEFDAAAALCTSYGEAKYNGCLGVPGGPLPPPELRARRRKGGGRRRGR